jgi:hypothetical protein
MTKSLKKKLTRQNSLSELLKEAKRILNRPLREGEAFCLVART